MAKANRSEWREFEKLVSRIEKAAGPHGMTVKSPDRIRSLLTGRYREVDASLRTKVGTTEVLITVECRKRKPTQDVTWIEQLATKKHAIGASRTVAVSATGFSEDARIAAAHYGIDLRTISEFSIEDINRLIQLDLVMFPRRCCSIVCVKVRFFQGIDCGWKLPTGEGMDWEVPRNIDPFSPLFTEVATNKQFSINDLWRQLQEVTNPFADIVPDGNPEMRSVCFAYPGGVVVETPNGTREVGDIVLTLALSKVNEMVWLKDAHRVEYASPDGSVLQRVEFNWSESPAKEYRFGLQIPKDSKDLADVKVTFDSSEGEQP